MPFDGKVSVLPRPAPAIGLKIPGRRKRAAGYRSAPVIDIMEALKAQLDKGKEAGPLVSQARLVKLAVLDRFNYPRSRS